MLAEFLPFPNANFRLFLLKNKCWNVCFFEEEVNGIVFQWFIKMLKVELKKILQIA